MNDVRGQFASEGTWRSMVDDPKDGHDVVEWIAKQNWSDGKVGTFGTSYSGGTQHALAEMNPPHLTTMVPIDALSNCGVAGMRHGGAFELRFMNWAFFMSPRSRQARANPALQAALDEQAHRIREHVDQLPLMAGTSPLRVVPELESWIVEALRAGPEDPVWHVKGMSVVDHVDDYADVPILHITGWYDSWTRQVAMNYEALSAAKKSPQRLVIGPWVHASQRSNVSGEVQFTDEAAIDLNAFRLRWYDHWMKGLDNGVEEDPPVLIYVMGTGDDRRSPDGRLLHGGFWRAEEDWPLERSRPRRLYLHADGSLDAEKPSTADSRTTFRFDPAHPVPTIGGNISSNNNLMTNGGYDQRPREDTHAADNSVPLSERPDVLVFRSEPLAEDIEVTGTVTVKLWVASTAPDTDFTAKLIDEVPPNADYPLGYDLNIGDSILRLRYREGLDHQATYEPGNARANHDPALSHLERVQGRAPGSHRRVQQQLPPVRREPEHRRTAGDKPSACRGRQHRGARCRTSLTRRSSGRASQSVRWPVLGTEPGCRTNSIEPAVGADCHTATRQGPPQVSGGCLRVETQPVRRARPRAETAHPVYHLLGLPARPEPADPD